MADDSQEQDQGSSFRKDFIQPVMRGLQSALIQSSFEKFGEAFTDTGDRRYGRTAGSSPAMAGWRQAGQQVQEAIAQRWQMAEFENFKKSHLDPFQANMKQLVEKSNYLNKELMINGRWEESDGSVTLFDLNKEADRVKAFRIKGQLESDTIMQVYDMQSALSMEAASRFPDNPFVDGVIQKLYEGASTALAGQFNAPTAAAGAGAEQAYRQGEADIAATKAGAKLQLAQAAGVQSEKTRINSLIGAYAQLGPGGIPGWLQSDPVGIELWAAARTPYVAEATQDFIEQRKRAPDITEAQLADDKFMEGEVARHASVIEKSAQGMWIRDSLGEGVLQDIAKTAPGYMPSAAAPVEPAIKGRVDPKVAEDVTKRWEKKALGELNKYLKEADLPPEQALESGFNYIMNEFLPGAISGQLPVEGMEDATIVQSQATQPLLSALRERIRAYLERNVGAGPSGKGLGLRRRGNPRGGLSRGLGIIAEEVTGSGKSRYHGDE